MCRLLCIGIYSIVSALSAAVNIDDKLDSPFATGCFKRISIGERLVIYDVSRTIERKRVKDCETDCNSYKCTYFSFGISASGNGTCELSSRREISRRGDPDYDIYQRTKHCTEGRPTGYEESCYRRFLSGKRLDDRLVRHSLPCDTLQACQHQCSVEQHFECRGFSIRLDDSGLGRGVCELTSVPTSYLDPVLDLNDDPEFDFYEKDLKNTSPNCGYINEVVSVMPKRNEPSDFIPNKPFENRGHPPWNNGPNQQVPWNYGDGNRRPMGPWHPGNDFRGGVPHPNEIPYNGRGPMKGHDLYHSKDWHQGRTYPLERPSNNLPGYVIIEADNRNAPGRGGPDPHRPQSREHQPHYPVVPHNVRPRPPDNFQHWNYGQNNNRQVCFQRQFPAFRLRPSMVREFHTMSSVSHCEEMCSTASYNCMGFTFRYTQLPDKGPNCFLTDFRNLDMHADLMPDRDCDVYSRLPNCRKVQFFPDTECFSRDFTDTALLPEVLRLRVSVMSIAGCELECLRADFFTCRSFTFVSRSDSTRENCWLSDWPAGALSPAQLIPKRGAYIYERGSFGRGCEYDVPTPPYIGPNPTDIAPYRPQQPRQWNRDAWEHFTVRGWPCRRGSQCTLNREAGFWSCEVEGGDHTQWDYCCRPQHACGHSQGYSYPWCYVGEAGADQWRPCSEHFYPSYENYHQHPPRHLHEQQQYEEYPIEAWSPEYGPPSSWPISYLYSQPPPNETIYFGPQEPPQSHHQPSYADEPPPQAFYEDSPMIQFKPSTPSSYPKAVVQKLDLKDMSNSDVPMNNEEVEEEQIVLNINPRINYAKKLKEEEPPKYIFASEGSLSNASGVYPNFVKGSTTADFMASSPLVNDTTASAQINKTKDILEQIEKIIANSTKNNSDKNCTEKKEALEVKPSQGIGYLVNATQTIVLKNGEDAMSRFWNWGQENFFSKDSKS